MVKLDVNKTAFWVTLIFILVSPIENILRTEQVVYVLGIAILVFCVIQRKYLLLNNSKYIIVLMIYMFLTCYWSAERQALNSLLVIYKDDLFFIPAGTVHAIGAGALVAEIQESSNLTYRLYDYDRIGKDGKKRELHIDKALDVANLYSSAEPKQPLRVLKYRQGVASELLTRCKYFEVYRMIVNTERRQTVHYRADELAFRVLLCVNGCGTISHENGTIPFYKGDCIFVPADSVTLTIHGQAQFLDVRG